MGHVSFPSKLTEEEEILLKRYVKLRKKASFTLIVYLLFFYFESLNAILSSYILKKAKRENDMQCLLVLTDSF